MTRIIYILAASHSGSTLLAMLLEQARELAVLRQELDELKKKHG